MKLKYYESELIRVILYGIFVLLENILDFIKFFLWNILFSEVYIEFNKSSFI